ncbi:MAG TPA: CvpA family protein [Pirellulales bacterium]
MQPYDVAMLAVLAAATAFGFVKGMAWQAASLASLVVGYFVSLRFSGLLAPYIKQPEPFNRFTAMLLLYLATSLAIWLAFRTVAQAIERVRLKEFDRQVGGLFGAAKGVLLCVVITFFAVTLSEKGRELVLASQSGHYIARLLQRADPIMPPEVHAVLDPYLKQLETELDPANPARRSPETAPRPGVLFDRLSPGQGGAGR